MVEIYWKPRSVTSFTATIVSAITTSIFCLGSLPPQSEGKQRLRQVLSHERKRIDNRRSHGDAAGHDPGYTPRHPISTVVMACHLSTLLRDQEREASSWQ